MGKQGGPDALLRHGRKVTRSFESELYFGDKVYRFELEPTADNRMMFQHESLAAGGHVSNAGHFESYVGQHVTDGTEQSVCNAITNRRVYHCHDTSETALVKQPEGFMPSTLLIDEPELGLHPYAIAVLAAQLKAVSLKHQVTVSTQSVELINEFEADDQVIVNRHFSSISEVIRNPSTVVWWLWMSGLMP
ncbi:AAA family ATPase [Endozoicomonas numazuensis]|uniref:Uncharacterized protein n=1 Tax=Endozoicomonas numazuensis TaxID=1137799 RepID=A0A081NHH6_9GAMM|nr:AAA family ATPase [Endozoicomonas numazuensis]KEQ17899.1 hypothetical protein GZ78_09685 [Endozoicomonas numazuensis]